MGKGTTTSTSDPWKKMPDFIKDAYKDDIAFRDDLLDQAKGVAGDLSGNPRQILGPNDTEYAGLGAGLAGFDKAGSLGDKAASTAGGLGSISDLVKKYISGSADLGQQAAGQVGGINSSIGKTQGIVGQVGQGLTDASGFARDTSISDQALGAANDDEAYTKALASAGYDMDALRQKYESGYTNDVVNTTLADMQRQAQRDQLARDAKTAAIGGTSNSRSGVADAVAGDLSGRAMATTEAQLRDAAFKTAISGAQGEAGLDLQRTGALNDLFSSKLNQAGVLDKLAQTGLDRGRLMDELAKTGIDLGGLQRGVTADKLSVGDYLRGLSDDDLKRASSSLDLGKFGIDTASLFDSLAGSAASRGTAEAGLLSGFGGLQRGLDQQQLDEDRTAGQQSLSWLANIFAGTPTDKGPNTTVTTEKTGQASPLQQVLGAGTSIAGAFLASDPAVKEDVEPLGSGLAALRDVHPASYRYAEGHGHVIGRTAGLMANELGHIPGAVVDDGSGVMKVDPYPVLATIVAAVKELDARIAA